MWPFGPVHVCRAFLPRRAESYSGVAARRALMHARLTVPEPISWKEKGGLMGEAAKVSKGTPNANHMN